MNQKDRNQVKADQLGMPFGTAMGKLRKSILFKLVQKCKEDTCYKCNTVICNIDDLSIEHKQPWLHVSPELFWDLENIAFSHIWCNKTDRPYLNRPKNFNEHLRIIGPEGTLWCSRHRKFLPTENFSLDAQKWSGRKSYCKNCRKEFKNAYV